MVLVRFSQIGLLENERHSQRAFPEIDRALSGRADDRDVMNALDLDFLHGTSFRRVVTRADGLTSAAFHAVAGAHNGTLLAWQP
jgi:hypothetical protein